jgi:hypothetical protein
MTNPSSELLEEHRDGVLWLTISRELRRNAISPGVLSGLCHAIERVQHERDVRAVVLPVPETRPSARERTLRPARPFASTIPSPMELLPICSGWRDEASYR